MKIAAHKLGHIPSLVLFTIIALAFVFYRESITTPNPDIAWLLLAAKRMLAGEHLYTDLLETNPPLIVWINIIPAWIAQRFSLDIFAVYTACVSALNLFILCLTGSVLARRKEPVAPRASLIYALVALFFFSTGNYGERELLFCALILPYLAQTLVGPAHEKYTPRTKCIYLLAGIGFAIKPFFLVIWGINELYLALYHRNLLRLFSRGNVIIACVQLLYIIAIYLLTPQFIEQIAPYELRVYFAFNDSWPSVLWMVGSVVGTTALVVWLANIQGPYRAAIAQLFALTLAASITMLVQRKTWLNHLYVLVFPACWCLYLTFISLLKDLKNSGVDIGYRKFTGLCFSLVAIALTLYLEANFTRDQLRDAGQKIEPLKQAIIANAPAGNVYPLSFNLSAGFPAIALSGAQFRGSFAHLWPLAGLMALEQKDGQLDAQAQQIKQFTLDTLVNDFTKAPPALVLVDKNVNLTHIGDIQMPKGSANIITYLSQDERFSDFWWQHYRYIGDVAQATPADDETPATDTKPETYELYSLTSHEQH